MLYGMLQERLGEIERRTQLSATKEKTVHSLELKQIEALCQPSHIVQREVSVAR